MRCSRSNTIMSVPIHFRILSGFTSYMNSINTHSVAHLKGKKCGEVKRGDFKLLLLIFIASQSSRPHHLPDTLMCLQRTLHKYRGDYHALGSWEDFREGRVTVVFGRLELLLANGRGDRQHVSHLLHCGVTARPPRGGRDHALGLIHHHLCPQHGVYQVGIVALDQSMCSPRPDPLLEALGGGIIKTEHHRVLVDGRPVKHMLPSSLLLTRPGDKLPGGGHHGACAVFRQRVLLREEGGHLGEGGLPGVCAGLRPA
mmetsp:Transcript_33455/g.46341  ORF Transcript_33455/g.46341 Transcript_33455/m.46341 type:complete len:256 (-) Transcript_33455:495-1262(-)